LQLPNLHINDGDLGLARVINGGPLCSGFAELVGNQVSLQLTVFTAGQLDQDRILGHLILLLDEQLHDPVAGQSENGDHAAAGLEPAEGADLSFPDIDARLFW
jgi:hypothetical protein